MSTATPLEELYPSQDDLLYEEEILRNPFSLKLWWRYLIARKESPFKKRSVLYERALKALPGSYKLWYAYLRERLEIVRNLPVTHSQYEILNNTFERALFTMHKMPKIWIMYLQTLTEQKLVTLTRTSFDRALCALPVTQHDRIWGSYIYFVSQRGIPIQTSLRVYRRYLRFDPAQIEDFIEFSKNSKLWQEAAERLAQVLNDDKFYSVKGKTKHQLWLELCDLLTSHATEVSGLDVDAIIRAGISKFTDMVGTLWTSLADYYIRKGLFGNARDVFEEGITTVVTVRDFSVIFDAYSQFELSLISARMDSLDGKRRNKQKEEQGKKKETVDDVRFNPKLSLSEFTKKILQGCWCNDRDDIDWRIARLDHLMDRRPKLANSVLLRQNPHNVEQWHRRVKLFEGNPAKQILTFTEAVKTVDPMKAVGSPHTLWISFAKLYVEHNDIPNARVIFHKAAQVNYRTVDNLATVLCEWAEMELKLKNFEGAREILRDATAEPSAEVKRRVAAGGNEPVQMKLHKSVRLWTLYADLEEGMGTLESTRTVYERILDLNIATPQIIINYASLLEEHGYFEDAFQVYERGVKIFKYPHAKDIWVTYLSKFVKRYGKAKMERARELFQHAVQTAPADYLKPLYLQYAKLEEDHGLAKRVMEVYDQAIKALPAKEKLQMYDIYITRATEFYGAPKTREIYEQAIESELPSKDVKTMCTKYADLEKSLGEIDRARAIYIFSSQFADPRLDNDFWSRWHEFEVKHGNEDTFREMLRIKRSVFASYSQTHIILPENLLQKDLRLNLEKTVDILKSVGDPEDEMCKLERRLATAAQENSTQSRVTRTPSGGRKVVADQDTIELPEGDDDEDVNEVEIARRDIPAAVFGDLAREAENVRKREKDGKLGALERIKRQKTVRSLIAV
ncbi:hypothetical protein MKW92_037633 [Papaver armeniacum]|nr:hypothetical protein MKW92_037633 [Papaver armeniacum]